MISVSHSRHRPQLLSARQWLALVIGLATLGVTVGLMLDDVAHGAAWTIEHTFGLALLFCIPAAGLVGRWALAHGERGPGIAFLVAAVLGSVLIVYLSAGRQHESRAEAQSSAINANASRASLEAEKLRIETRIADLRSDLARLNGVRSSIEVKAALDTVVGNGPGKVSPKAWRHTNGCAADRISGPVNAAACDPVSALRIENGKALERDSLRRRIDAAEADRAKVVGKLEAAGGERVVPSKARAFAELVGLFGLNAARVEMVASRLDLVIRTLFLEGLTIVALEYALAGVGRPASAPSSSVPAAPVSAPRSPRPKGQGRRGRKADPVVVDFVARFREKHGRPPSGGEVRSAFPEMPTSTAYEYAKRA